MGCSDAVCRLPDAESRYHARSGVRKQPMRWPPDCMSQAAVITDKGMPDEG